MERGINDTILIGDQRTLSFETKVAKGEKLQFQELSNPIIEGVELIGKIQSDTTLIGGDSIALQNSFTITSFDSGSYKLPKFQALLFRKDGGVDTLHFDAGTLEVATIEIDTTTYRPFDVKDQMGYPVTAREVLSYVGLSLFIALLLFLIYKGIKRLRGKGGLFTKEKEREPAHIVALRELEKLRASKVWVKDQKLFFTEVTEVLRLYIEERYRFPTMERTSAEILEQFSNKKIEPELYNTLSSLFSTADLVKFAKYSATQQECEESIPIAVKFINDSYVAEIEEREESIESDS